MHMKIEGRKLALNLDIHKNLTQELKIIFKEDGVYITSVDPSHIAMAATVLKNTACEEYNIRETGELTIGIDYLKIRDFLKIGKPSDVFTFDYDPESNRLVARLGNLVRTMGLLDIEGMPDLKNPELSWANKTVIPAKILHKSIKSVRPDGNKTRFSTRRGYLTVTEDSFTLENYSDDEKENRTEKISLMKDQDLISNAFGVPTTIIFGFDDIQNQVNEFTRSFKEVAVETNGNETPIRISASNEDMIAEYYHAVIIEHEERPYEQALPEEQPKELKPETDIPEPGPELEIVANDPEPEMPMPDIAPEPVMVARVTKKSRKVHKDIGWLASPRDDMHIVGEVIKVTKTTYVLLFRGSKQHKEPVEYEKDLVEVYRKKEEK